MTANFLQFQENGHEIWITIPPRVEHDQNGEKVEASETKKVSLNNLHSAAAASGRKQESGDDLASSKLPFVWKLYEMLEDVESSKQEDVVSWVRNGKAFKVHQLEKFVEDIIPKYCKLSKYKSFQRQLYFYGFTRIQEGPDEGAYHHPKFVRGKKTLCLSMTPKNNSRRRRRSSASSTATKNSMRAAAHQVATERPASPCSVSTATSREDDDTDMKPAPCSRNSVASEEGKPGKSSSQPSSVAVPEELALERQPTDQSIANGLGGLLLADNSNTITDEKCHPKTQQGHQQRKHEGGYVGQAGINGIDFVFGDMPFHSIEDLLKHDIYNTGS